MTETLLLRRIEITPDTQVRVRMDWARVEEFKRLMAEGTDFPPITVFGDGQAYWLGDGFHRFEAVRELNRREIAVEVKPGNARDAFLFGLEANLLHGLPLSDADKRHAVMILLLDCEWSV